MRWAAGSVAVLLLSPEALSCPRGSPWVRVDAPAEVKRLLRAELATRDIELCDAPDADAPPPIATVTTSLGDASAVVRVEVHDAITAKVVSRDVSLEAVPADTRMLTVALAADELLRASWAELALHAAPPPALTPPPQVEKIVHDQVSAPAASTPPRFALGAAATIDAFFGASTLLGADMVVSVWAIPRLRFEARFGARAGLAESGPDGDVSTSVLGGKVGAAVTITPPGRVLGVDLAARVGFFRVSFVPTPRASAIGTAASDVAVVGDATVEGWVKLARSLRLVAVAGPTVALRPVRILDGVTNIGGIDGAGVVGSFALVGTF